MGIAAEEDTVHPNVARLLARQHEWPAQQSEAWWFARQAMLTASDVSAVLGTSPYASA
jgi:predicted phage-related endonuclease